MMVHAHLFHQAKSGKDLLEVLLAELEGAEAVSVTVLDVRNGLDEDRGVLQGHTLRPQGLQQALKLLLSYAQYSLWLINLHFYDKND